VKANKETGARARETHSLTTPCPHIPSNTPNSRAASSWRCRREAGGGGGDGSRGGPTQRPSTACVFALHPHTPPAPASSEFLNFLACLHFWLACPPGWPALHCADATRIRQRRRTSAAAASIVAHPLGPLDEPQCSASGDVLLIRWPKFSTGARTPPPPHRARGGGVLDPEAGAASGSPGIEPGTDSCVCSDVASCATPAPVRLLYRSLTVFTHQLSPAPLRPSSPVRHRWAPAARKHPAVALSPAGGIRCPLPGGKGLKVAELFAA
jgi:hypothetical protein